MSPTAAGQYYGDITNYMYYNYTDAWLLVPTSFQVYSVDVHGIIPNPDSSATGFQFIDNTDYI